MEKYIMFENSGIITIQEAEYIEDGWRIEIIGNLITLYEIPLHGGQESKIGNYETIIKAINAGKALT